MRPSRAGAPTPPPTPEPSPGARWVHAAPGPAWTLRQSGAYVYARRRPFDPDFIPLPVREHYAVWAHGESTERRIRSARDARATPHGVELRVHAVLSDGPRATLEFEVLDPRGSRLARAGYRREGATLHWDAAPANAGGSMPLSKGALLLPLTRNYLGPVIAEAATRDGGMAPVVVPAFNNPRAAGALEPDLATRAARRVSSGTERISAGGRDWECHVYQFVGGPYGPGSLFWICPDTQRLIRYVFELEQGERWLTELVDGPPTNGSTDGRA